MNNCQQFNTALYLRLSRDDGTDSTSESIYNQKDFLTRYAIENGWNIVDVYADDGWSGTNFQRPEFTRMIADIEAGKINCVVTKDLSRLGRDYITTGHYVERYFPQKKVRYVAVNDGVDSFADSGGNDMSAFRSVINEKSY